MEFIKKIKLKQWIALIIVIGILISIFSIFEVNKTNKIKSYFDIYLSNIYNDHSDETTLKNLNFLSSLNKNNVSLFADLKLNSIIRSDNYSNLEKELIRVKYAIISNDNDELKRLFNQNNSFPQTISIHYLNNNLSILPDKFFNENIETNFFEKAVKFYLNDN